MNIGSSGRSISRAGCPRASWSRLLGADDEAAWSHRGHSNDGTRHVRSRRVRRPPARRRSAEARVETTLPFVGTRHGRGGIRGEAERSSTVALAYTTSPTNGVATVTPGADDRRETRGVYVALQGTPAARVAYDASVRFDQHSDFQAVWRRIMAVLSLNVWSGGRVRASYGTGFNAPAFYETQGSAYNRAEHCVAAGAGAHARRRCEPGSVR